MIILLLIFLKSNDRTSGYYYVNLVENTQKVDLVFWNILFDSMKLTK